MISTRLQLLPTGLISMLSYFLGLMYSEVVLAHLQLRFPFTSRMAERERRWQLTSCADKDAAAPGAKGNSPSRVFTDSTAGTTVRGFHLCLYFSSLLPHGSQKLNQSPAKDGCAFSLANNKASPQLSRQQDPKLPSRSWHRIMPAKAAEAHLHGQSGTSPAAAAAARGTGGPPSSGKAQPRRLRDQAHKQPYLSGRVTLPHRHRIHTSAVTPGQQSTDRGDVISQMLPTASPEAQWSIFLTKTSH